jgi:hypothetical protein
MNYHKTQTNTPTYPINLNKVSPAKQVKIEQDLEIASP